MALTLTDALAGEWMDLSAEDRQHGFFEYLPKTLTVWGLKGDDGWVMTVQNEIECLPIWSHEILATKWLERHHPNVQAQAISLNEFKQVWLPGLDKNSVGVIISPSATRDDAVQMTAKDCLDAIG